MSFVNATLVLSIGETVEEVTDSGFLGTTPTLSCSSLGDDALVQVYPDGIRHIRSDRRVNEWKAPGKKSITKCAVNQRQVVITLSGRELVYFEMDAVSIFDFFGSKLECFTMQPKLLPRKIKTIQSTDDNYMKKNNRVEALCVLQY